MTVLEGGDAPSAIPLDEARGDSPTVNPPEEVEVLVRSGIKAGAIAEAEAIVHHNSGPGIARTHIAAQPNLHPRMAFFQKDGSRNVCICRRGETSGAGRKQSYNGSGRRKKRERKTGSNVVCFNASVPSERYGRTSSFLLACCCDCRAVPNLSTVHLRLTPFDAGIFWWFIPFTRCALPGAHFHIDPK